MLFLRRLVTGFVLSFILWVGVSIGALGVGGAIVGVEAAQQHSATDFQSGYVAGQSAGREFGRRYGPAIFLGALAVSVLMAAAFSYSPLFPWCRAPAGQPASGARTSRILEWITSVVLILMAWSAIGVLSALGLRRHANGNTAWLHPAPLPAQPVASFNPQAVRDAKVEAVRLYPDLGIAGSRMNAEYVARYDRYRAQNPGYFLDTNWPLTLADETAKALREAGQQAAPSAPAPSASAALTGSSN